MRAIIAFITALGILGFLLFRLFFPDCYPAWYWIIPVFFIINASLIQWLMLGKQRTSPLSIPLQMTLRMGKLFTGLLIIILYLVLVKTNGISFTICFFIFYLIYSICETWVLVKYTKQLNKE